MADRGVTLLRDSARLLPLDATRPLRVLLVALSADPDAARGKRLSRRFVRASIRFGAARGHAVYECEHAQAASPETYDVAIAALSCAWRTGRATSDFPRISERL